MTNPAEDEQLSAMDIAWQFVSQYYTHVNKFPGKVHCFYHEHSQVVRGLVGQQVQSVTGLDRISQLASQYQPVAIDNVDAQQCSGDGILVFVGGRVLSSAVQFTQTFYLAPQENGYFVSNDIYRQFGDGVGGISAVADDAVTKNGEAAAGEQQSVRERDDHEINTDVQGAVQQKVQKPVNTVPQAAEINGKQSATPQANMVKEQPTTWAKLAAGNIPQSQKSAIVVPAQQNVHAKAAHVKQAQFSSNGGDPKQIPREPNSILLSELPVDVTEKELREAFSKADFNIRGLRMESDNRAVIKFDSFADSRRAVSCALHLRNDTYKIKMQLNSEKPPSAGQYGTANGTSRKRSEGSGQRGAFSAGGSRRMSSSRGNQYGSVAKSVVAGRQNDDN